MASKHASFMQAHHRSISINNKTANSLQYVANYQFAMHSQFNEQAELQEERTPEERLRLFVRWFIYQAIGINLQPSFLDQIHMQEMMNPSPVLDKVVVTFIRPNHMKLRATVSALLPKNATENQIRHHCFSVVGQCLHYKFVQPVMTRLYDDIEFTQDYADELTEHITNVSLAGMRAAKEKKL